MSKSFKDILLEGEAQFDRINSLRRPATTQSNAPPIKLVENAPQGPAKSPNDETEDLTKFSGTISGDPIKKSVRHWLNRVALYNPKRGWYLESGLDIVTAARDHFYKMKSKTRLENAIDMLSQESYNAFLSNLQDIVTTKTKTKNIEKWVEAATGRLDPLDVAVVKHFIWQVQRKLLGLPVTDHLMIIMSGPEGTGKSTAIAKLISPLEGVSTNVQGLGFLSDDRAFERLRRNFIVICDDIQSMEKLDGESLKGRLTDSLVTYRRLGTHVDRIVPNNATFLGSTNRAVDQIIFDSTGARRFFDLKCRTDRDNQKAHQTINQLDYTLLWGEVDPYEPSPIKAFQKELRAAQEALRTETPVEEWLESLDGVEGWYRMTAILENFAHYQAKVGRPNKGMSKQKMKRALIEKAKIEEKRDAQNYPIYWMKLGPAPIQIGQPHTEVIYPTHNLLT